MAIPHQKLVRFARLLADGKDYKEVCGELDITVSTFYRWKRSPEYDAVFAPHPVEVPRDHPDMVEARDMVANTAKVSAAMVGEASVAILTAILEKARNADREKLGDLVAAGKWLMETHAGMLREAPSEDVVPTTPEEVLEMLRAAVPAEVLKAAGEG